MNMDHLRSIRLHEFGCVKDIIEEMTSDKDGVASILEVGAGAGWQAKALAEEGYDVKAVDLENCLYTENRVWPITTYDGKHLPFEDDSFDVIFSSNVLEHVPHIEEFQSELQRVLKPGGVAIHLMPTAVWRFWETVLRYPLIVKIVFKMVYARVRPSARERLYSSAEQTAMSQRKEGGKLMFIKRALIPSRHGEFGNCITEMYYFSRNRWQKLFERTGWRIERYSPSNLFYTGTMIFGPAIPLSARESMSRILGSACHVFILRHGDGTGE